MRPKPYPFLDSPLPPPYSGPLTGDRDHEPGGSMANVPQELKYTEEHEYVKSEGANEVVVGITDYAQGELGDVVFVELPKVGASYKAHEVFGTIEAVKAVSELFSPVSGEVVAVNDALDGNPALVNSDP